MPHLSPMHWIMSIIMFWFIMMTISSNFWWAQPNKFTQSKINKSQSVTTTWKW